MSSLQAITVLIVGSTLYILRQAHTCSLWLQPGAIGLWEQRSRVC